MVFFSHILKNHRQEETIACIKKERFAAREFEKSWLSCRTRAVCARSIEQIPDIVILQKRRGVSNALQCDSIEEVKLPAICRGFGMFTDLGSLGENYESQRTTINVRFSYAFTKYHPQLGNFIFFVNEEMIFHTQIKVKTSLAADDVFQVVRVPLFIVLVKSGERWSRILFQSKRI